MASSRVRPAANTARLWAPWRSHFLSQRKGRRCIFCAAKRARSHDRIRYVVARGVRVFAMLNRYPYTNGHFMIAPYRHVGGLTALTRTEWLETRRLCQRLMARLQRALRPHGFNVGFNVGRVAGAGFPGHIHLHVVPRWTGDTNFMPVLSDTRIISQSLDEVYALLSGARRSA